MTRTVQEITTEMLSTGLTQHQLSLMVELLAASSVVRQSSDIADERRQKDREYRRLKRENDKQNKGKAEANDAATSPVLSSDCRPTNADTSPLLTSFLSSESQEEKRTSEKGRKKEKVSGCARGTRLSPAAPLTLNDLDFALSAGLTEAEARSGWVEFLDYWVTIPGQRGVKLDWSATWRNNVRRMVKFKAGTRHANTGNNAKPGSWQGARDGFRAARADLKAGIAAAESSGLESGESSGPPIRLVAPAGRG